MRRGELRVVREAVFSVQGDAGDSSRSRPRPGGDRPRVRQRGRARRPRPRRRKLDSPARRREARSANWTAGSPARVQTVPRAASSAKLSPVPSGEHLFDHDHVGLEQRRLARSPSRAARRRKISLFGSASPIGSAAFTCAPSARWKYGTTRSSHSRKLAAGRTTSARSRVSVANRSTTTVNRSSRRERTAQPRLLGIRRGDVDVPADERAARARVLELRSEVHVPDRIRSLGRGGSAQVVLVDAPVADAVEVQEAGARAAEVAGHRRQLRRLHARRSRRAAGAGSPGRSTAATARRRTGARRARPATAGTPVARSLHAGVHALEQLG